MSLGIDRSQSEGWGVGKVKDRRGAAGKQKNECGMRDCRAETGEGGKTCSSCLSSKGMTMIRRKWLQV